MTQSQKERLFFIGCMLALIALFLAWYNAKYNTEKMGFWSFIFKRKKTAATVATPSVGGVLGGGGSSPAAITPTASAAGVRHLFYNSNTDIGDASSSALDNTWKARYDWCAANGVTGIQVVYRWFMAEPSPNNFRWGLLDTHLNYIISKGMKVGITLDLLREDQSSIGQPKDFVQFFPDGHEMKYQNGSQALFLGWSVCPSFSSTQGVNAAMNFVSAAAQHLSSYQNAGHILHIGMRYGEDGEQSYTAHPDTNAMTDYSQPTKDEFKLWLAAKYGNISALNSAYSSAYSAFSQVNPPCPNGVCSIPNAGTFDWNLPSGRDWLRFRFVKAKYIFDSFVARVKSANSSYKTMYLFPEIGLQQATMLNSCTNIAYLCENADLVYSSAGSSPSDISRKVALIDIIKGTFPNKQAGIEFDLADVYDSGNYGDFLTTSQKVYDRGGQFVFLALFATIPQFEAIGSGIRSLRDNYLGRGVSSRSGLSTYTYPATQLLSGGDPAYQTWLANGGQTHAINVQQINDLV